MVSMADVVYAAEPPAGVQRNPQQPYDADVLLVVTSIFFALATASVAIRVYTRAFVVHMLVLDDYIMMLAWLCDILLVGFVFNLLNFGLGKHMWNVPIQPDIYPNFSLNNVLAAIFFCAATGLAKGSILLFYLRIFPAKPVRISTWIVFIFTITYSAACVLVNIFACQPIQSSWQLEYVATARCINRPVFYFAQAALGIVTDIATVLIPVRWLWMLHLPTKQKIVSILLLTVGGFVCIVSIIRLKSLYTLLADADLTENTVVALMWCLLELNLSITGGCIPAAKPFFQKVFPGLLESTRGRREYNDIDLPQRPSYRTNTGSSTERSHDAKALSWSRQNYHTCSEEQMVPHRVSGGVV